MSKGQDSLTRLAIAVREHVWWGPVLLLAIVLRFYRLDSATLWADEAFSVVMSAHPASTLLAVAVLDVHPPLYYLLLGQWIELFGNGLFSVRSLSACAGVVTVGLGTWLVALVANRRAAMLAGVLLAMLPIAVRYSQEVRMYALLAVWMTGATIALVYWIRQPRRFLCLGAYALLIAAGLYTHYLAITGVIAHWLYVMTLPRSSNEWGVRPCLTRQWWAANIVAALLFLPWLPEFSRQLSLSCNLSWIQPVTVQAIASVLWQYLTLEKGQGLPIGVFWGVLPVTLAVCAYCLFRDRQHQHFPRLLVILLLAPLIVVFVVSLHVPMLMARYLTFSAVYLPLLLGVGIERVAREHLGLAALTAVAIMGIECVGLSHLHQLRDYTNSDDGPTQERVNQIADVINANYMRGDQIVVLNLFYYPAFDYYNRSPIRPLFYAPFAPAGAPKSCQAPRHFSAPYGAGLEDVQIARLDQVPAGTVRVWLVDHGDDANVGLEIPCHWQLRKTLTTGDNRLRLFDAVAGQASSTEKACSTP